MDAEISGLKLTLCNVYGFNDDNTEFYIDIIQHVEAQPNDNRIVGGDFNPILNSEIDKNGTTTKKAQILTNNWMELTELADIWRFKHPDSHKYTWYIKNPQAVFYKLDFFFFLVSYDIRERPSWTQIRQFSSLHYI